MTTTLQKIDEALGDALLARIAGELSRAEYEHLVNALLDQRLTLDHEDIVSDFRKDLDADADD